jgi:catechol 2,3-dioxygenase-like lactoylglutathione lyase family enzyme
MSENTQPAFTGFFVTFLVDDIAGTVDYYRDVLGFDVEWIWGEPPVAACVTRGAVGIMPALASIRGARNSMKAVNGGANTDIYVQVEDVQAVYQEVVARGAHATGAPEAREYGMIDFNVEDPNGYTIGFGQPA